MAEQRLAIVSASSANPAICSLGIATHGNAPHRPVV
jgi:hypothetical protein